jgi:hypothetical protein
MVSRLRIGDQVFRLSRTRGKRARFAARADLAGNRMAR